MAQVLDVMAACDVQPCSVAGVYMEFEGSLSPNGHHGHLGMYQREITPTHVSYVNGVGPENCDWSPPREWLMSM